MCNELLSSERSKLARYSLSGDLLDYSDHSDFGIDHMESARDFLQSIEDFIYCKAQELAAARINKGLPDGLDKQKLTRWKHPGSQLQSKLFLSLLRTGAYRTQ